MSIHVWVPDGNAGQPGFAVQRSGSGRLSIAAGQIGQDTSLFGVTGDQNGLTTNVFLPAKQWQYNLCPNPRFFYNVTDAWTNLGANVARVQISAGNYVARMYYGTSGEFYCEETMPEYAEPEEYLVANFVVNARLAGCGAYFEMVDESGTHQDSDLAWTTGTRTVTMNHAVTSAITSWKLRVLVPPECNLEGEALDVTQVRVDFKPTADAMSYRDGDMHGGVRGGWWWLGDAHNSVSRGPVGDG